MVGSVWLWVILGWILLLALMIFGAGSGWLELLHVSYAQLDINQRKTN